MCVSSEEISSVKDTEADLLLLCDTMTTFQTKTSCSNAFSRDAKHKIVVDTLKSLQRKWQTVKMTTWKKVYHKNLSNCCGGCWRLMDLFLNDKIKNISTETSV